MKLCLGKGTKEGQGGGVRILVCRSFHGAKTLLVCWTICATIGSCVILTTLSSAESQHQSLSFASFNQTTLKALALEQQMETHAAHLLIQKLLRGPSHTPDVLGKTASHMAPPG